MKITLDKLNYLKDFIKLAWIARQAGWDRSTMHGYVNDDYYNMASTPESVEKLKKVLGALKTIRSRVSHVIQYYEDMLVALDHSGDLPKNKRKD